MLRQLLTTDHIISGTHVRLIEIPQHKYIDDSQRETRINNGKYKNKYCREKENMITMIVWRWMTPNIDKILSQNKYGFVDDVCGASTERKYD